MYNFYFQKQGYQLPPYNFNFGSGDNYYILNSTSNNFTGVWVSNNKLYITSVGSLNIIDLSTKTLIDWYSTTHIGRANEKLFDDKIVDVNVS